MYLFIIAGHTGQGKSAFTKKYIEGKKKYVFDINNEYNYPDDKRGMIYSEIRHVDMDFEKFISNCKSVKNYNVVVEDATGFLRGRIGSDFVRLIQAKRHTNNTYILLFHSINRVPPELMEFCNYFVLFKTIDNIDNVNSKFKNKNLTDAFLELKDAPDHSHKILKLI